MNLQSVRHLIIEALLEVAPEINADDIDADAELREAFDIDSMDYLNFIAALKRSCGVSIPEGDYRNMDTLNRAMDYLKKKLPSLTS